jgi:hypothetical protein
MSTIILNPKKHNPAPDYARKLVDKVGLTQATIAAGLGLDPRTFRRYLQEQGTKGATPMPYTVQRLLELLAAGRAELR